MTIPITQVKKLGYSIEWSRSHIIFYNGRGGKGSTLTLPFGPGVLYASVDEAKKKAAEGDEAQKKMKARMAEL